MYVIVLILLSVLETTKQTNKPDYIKFKSKVLKQIDSIDQIIDLFHQPPTSKKFKSKKFSI